MGLLDLFKKKNIAEPQLSTPKEPVREEGIAAKPIMDASISPTTAAVPLPAVKQPHNATTMTQKLIDLVAVPQEQRDAAWGDRFIENMGGAIFKIGDPNVIKGPDGFPYLHLLLPSSPESTDAVAIAKMKDDFILADGIGAVINPENGRPDWVLSYGDIVNLHINHTFYTQDSDFSAETRTETFKESEEVLIAQPAESLLPMATRNVIRNFLQQNGVATPKVLLMMRRTGEHKERTSLDLVFNITPQNASSEEHYNALMRSLGWFMPGHYSYAGMDESSFEGKFEIL